MSEEEFEAIVKREESAQFQEWLVREGYAWALCGANWMTIGTKVRSLQDYWATHVRPKL